MAHTLREPVATRKSIAEVQVIQDVPCAVRLLRPSDWHELRLDIYVGWVYHGPSRNEKL